MWNNPYFITLLLIGYSSICDLILKLIAVLMGAGGKSIFLPTLHLSAYMLGQVYASKQRKLMPSSLRLRSTICCCLWTYLTLIIFMHSINPAAFTLSTVPYGTALSMIFLPLISSVLLYLTMGWGAKFYLKKMGI